METRRRVEFIATGDLNDVHLEQGSDKKRRFLKSNEWVWLELDGDIFDRNSEFLDFMKKNLNI